MSLDQSLFFYYYYFVYLFLAVVGLCCCMGFSLVLMSCGYSLVAVHGLLMAVASSVAEHGLWGPRASVFEACGPAVAVSGF